MTRPIAEEVALWKAFADRVTLTFAFRIDVLVSLDSRPPPHGERVKMAVDLHVPDRDTRESITVLTGRHCAPWTNDEDAIEMLFDLLEIALRHEAHESVRLDGQLVRDLHKMQGPRS